MKEWQAYTLLMNTELILADHAEGNLQTILLICATLFFAVAAFKFIKSI